MLNETYDEFVERESVEEKEIIFFQKEDVAILSPTTNKIIMHENLIMRWIYGSPYDIFWRVELVSNKRGILHTSYGVIDYEDAFKMCEIFSIKLSKEQKNIGDD